MDIERKTADMFIKALASPGSSFLASRGIGELRAPYNSLAQTPFPPCCSMILMLQGRPDPRWLPAARMPDMGLLLRPGAKSTVLYFRHNQSTEVYNAEDVVGLKKREPYREIDEQRVMRQAEKMIRDSGVTVFHTTRPADCGYSPADDAVYLPGKQCFANEADYYAAAIHQLALASGRPGRLGRETFHEYDKAREELYASVAGYLTAAETGMGYRPVTDPRYIRQWQEILQENPGEFYKAASLGSRIKDYLVNGNQQCIEFKPAQRQPKRFSRQAAGMEY